jgi:hypothetical protein
MPRLPPVTTATPGAKPAVSGCHAWQSSASRARPEPTKLRCIFLCTTAGEAGAVRGEKKWKNAKKLFPLQVYNPLTFEEEEQQRGARRGLARRAGGQVGQR